MTEPNTSNNLPGGTSRTESELCKRAYESLNPLSRYDPSNPQTPLYALERLWTDKDTTKRFEVFSKNIVQKYLDVSNPFQLKTHNPDNKLTKIKLEQAMDCIWKKYYAPLERIQKQNTINEFRKRKNNIGQNNFDEYFNVKKGYINQMSLKSSFEKFIKRILESSNLDVTNNSISEECSTFMNPTDVFAPCSENCIDITRSGAKKNLTQPRLMQKELTKFDNTLKDMYAHLMKSLEDTKKELKSELESNKVHNKRIKEIIGEKFGAITTVPDSYTDSVSNKNNDETLQNKRRMETEKKRRQRLQNKLIKEVINNKGRLVSKYDDLFTLETPFDLTDKGKRISKNTGQLKTKYDRSNKRIELQLRFKVNQALKSTNDLINEKVKKGEPVEKELYRKANILRNLSDKPHANKPLKLVKVNGKKTTVARGGDKALRQIISLFGIQEFKDKLDGMKQKYALTEKTEKTLDYPTSIFTLRQNNQKHPTVGNFKYFPFKDLESTVENLFLDYLYRKIRDVQVGKTVNIDKLKTYEKIDIPYVKTYKLDYRGNLFLFEMEKSGVLKVISKKFSNFGNTTSKNLKYQMNMNADFSSYNEAVRLARKMVRASPNKFLKNENVARFYLRNEDKYRMEPIENILRLMDLHVGKAVASPRSPPSPVTPTTNSRAAERPSTPDSKSTTSKSLRKPSITSKGTPIA
jgi:hypothetical protein